MIVLTETSAMNCIPVTTELPFIQDFSNKVKILIFFMAGLLAGLVGSCCGGLRGLKDLLVLGNCHVGSLIRG